MAPRLRIGDAMSHGELGDGVADQRDERMSRSAPTLSYAGVRSPRRNALGEIVYSVVVTLLLFATVLLCWPGLGCAWEDWWRRLVCEQGVRYWQSPVVIVLWENLCTLSLVSLAIGLSFGAYSWLWEKERRWWFWVMLTVNLGITIWFESRLLAG